MKPYQINESIFKVLKSLQNAGFESWFVGGCVRDSILKINFNDFDIATIATPLEIIKVLNQYDLDCTHSKYGCIKLVIDNFQVEITTFRKDIATYGRQATVEFTNSIKEDAQRRDFTINAIYWDGTNNWLDFFNGKYDIEKKIVKFIGDPETRINQDYLRILRFFRFSAIYAEELNTDGLNACIKNHDNLKYISGTRVWYEWERILKGKNAYLVLNAMQEHGLISAIFGCNAKTEIIKHYRGNNMLLLTRLILDELHINFISHRLNLNKEQFAWLEIAESIKEKTDFKTLYFLYKEKAKELVYFWAAKFNKNCDDILSESYWQKDIPVFPLSGKDLIAIGCKAGPDIGQCLNKVKKWWISKCFSPTYEECLDYARSSFINKN